MAPIIQKLQSQEQRETQNKTNRWRQWVPFVHLQGDGSLEH